MSEIQTENFLDISCTDITTGNVVFFAVPHTACQARGSGATREIIENMDGLKWHLEAILLAKPLSNYACMCVGQSDMTAACKLRFYM